MLLKSSSFRVQKTVLLTLTTFLFVIGLITFPTMDNPLRSTLYQRKFNDREDLETKSNYFPLFGKFRNQSKSIAHGKTNPLDKILRKRNKINPNEQLDWQPVTGSKYKFSVFSAYSYDQKQVIMIGTTKSFTEEIVACIFHYHNRQDLKLSTIGTVETMDEHWNLEYAGVFIRCPLPTSFNRILPDAVSAAVIVNISEGKGQIPDVVGNMLTIQYKSKMEMRNPKFNFSVCVLPAFNYDEVFHVLEWMEFNKLMGANHFTFYNISFGPATSCILNELAQNPDKYGAQVHVHPWHKFPIRSRFEIRAGPCAECGLSAATNDCIYRHKGLSKYMAIVDFDEFIMPRTGEDFGELITFLDVINKSVEIGEYSIRNGFFPKARPNDELVESTCNELKLENNLFAYHVCKQLLMVKKTARAENVLMHADRSKYIVKPEAIREGGNHHVMKLEYGYETLIAPPEVVLLRHYRVFDGLWKYASNATVVPDRIPKRFGVKLARKVATQIERFFHKCKLRVNDLRFWAK